MSEERSRKPEPPFCWQNKEARERIREHMNADSKAASVLSLYDALTEIASDEGVESFKAGQPYIGTKAGMSGRNVDRLEPFLEECGVVIITRHPKRGHHTYTLVSFSGQIGQSVRSRRPARSDNLSTQIGQSVSPVKTIVNHNCLPVEEPKEPKEQKEREEAPFSSLSDAVAFFEDEFPTKPVKASLSDLKEKKGKAYLTESYCRKWLEREERRIQRKRRLEDNPDYVAAKKRFPDMNEYEWMNGSPRLDQLWEEQYEAERNQSAPP